MNGTNFIVGTSGVAISEVASQVELPTSGDTSEVIKIVVQIIIAVATLFGMFKKKPKSN
jgi:hypothetical protein